MLDHPCIFRYMLTDFGNVKVGRTYIFEWEVADGHEQPEMPSFSLPAPPSSSPTPPPPPLPSPPTLAASPSPPFWSPEGGLVWVILAGVVLVLHLLYMRCNCVVPSSLRALFAGNSLIFVIVAVLLIKSVVPFKVRSIPIGYLPPGTSGPSTLPLACLPTATLLMGCGPCV